VTVLGVQGFGDGALIRAKDMKIYVIKNAKKNHIVNLNELKKYSGRAINNVDESTLAQY